VMIPSTRRYETGTYIWVIDRARARSV
jgi:hypothetical protein